MKLLRRLLVHSSAKLVTASRRMSEQASKIPLVFISCGSFNPVTNLHLRMFEIAKDHFAATGKYDIVAGIMSPVNDGYKKKGLISAEQRCAMLELALANNEWVQLNSWEADQTGWTPTLEVLRHHRDVIRKLYGSNVQLMFLCGGDLVESFQRPGVWEEDHIRQILTDYGLAVINRMGSLPEQIIYENDILYEKRHNINLITDCIVNDVSSTKIRRAVSRNESIKYLTSELVEKYIKDNNLYKK